MGFAGISIWQLLIVLVIVIALFGTKRFRQAGSDFGGMIRGVKDGFKTDDQQDDVRLQDIAQELGDAKRELQKAAKELKD